ncbi:MAG: sigma-70 family RNA polymerase sigma factor [Nitriliruptorales bacterium]|nr:sigma-70 family RNA polymerase sigma factor [Nitriliruptorales bacterium]
MAGAQHGGATVAAATFSDLAREHLPRLYSLARRLVADEAEDLVQECLLKAFRSFDGLRDTVAAEAWLNRILANCAKDRFRRQQRRPETPIDPIDEFSLYRTIASEDPFPYSDSLHLDFLCRFGTEDVWVVLAQLPMHYRMPLVLVHMEGWRTAEVADFLDVPLGTLLSWLHRGRKLFERSLWRYAVDNDLLRGAS